MTRQYQLGSTYLLSLGDGREYQSVDAYVNEEAAAAATKYWIYPRRSAAAGTGARDMYPKNAASPPRIAIGPVVQISDGAVQTSGCTVRVLAEGQAEADGGGTTSYSTDGVVCYVPTQAETNYTAFVLIAKKTGCIPASVTVVTTASATAGQTVVATNNDKTGYTASTVSDKTGYSLTATTGLGNQTANITGNLSGSVGSVTGAVGSISGVTFPTNFADLNITATTGLVRPDMANASGNYAGTVATVTTLTNLPAITTNWLTAAGLAADAVTEIQSGLATASALATVDGIIDNIFTAMELDGAVYRFTTNALEQAPSGGLDAAGVRSAVGLASANLDTQLGDLPTAVENADALLGRNIAGGSSTGRTVKQALAKLRNKWAISAGTLTVYDTDDATPLYTETLTSDAAGEPITASDPTT